jgi:hypothetical protein
MSGRKKSPRRRRRILATIELKIWEGGARKKVVRYRWRVRS